MAGHLTNFPNQLKKLFDFDTSTKTTRKTTNYGNRVFAKTAADVGMFVQKN